MVHLLHRLYGVDAPADLLSAVCNNAYYTTVAHTAVNQLETAVLRTGEFCTRCCCPAEDDAVEPTALTQAQPKASSSHLRYCTAQLLYNDTSARRLVSVAWQGSEGP